MLKRIVPHGRKVCGSVEDVEPRGKNEFPKEPKLVLIVGEDGEGYALVHIKHDIEPKKGQYVEMEFCHNHLSGVGGCWIIRREVERPTDPYLILLRRVDGSLLRCQDFKAQQRDSIHWKITMEKVNQILIEDLEKALAALKEQRFDGS